MDRAAFDTFVRTQGPDLYRYAFWLCGDAASAEDLVQEACLRAWRSRDALRTERAARGWVITIVRREFLRRLGRPHEVLVPVDVATEGPEPAEVLALREAVGALDPMYREPLVLQIVWGFSAKEIAELLELTPQAVMTRTFRARLQLRQVLGRHHGRSA